MPYPHVIQFEFHKLELERRLRFAETRRLHVQAAKETGCWQPVIRGWSLAGLGRLLRPSQPENPTAARTRATRRSGFSLSR
jgi:hypothetical protein